MVWYSCAGTQSEPWDARASLMLISCQRKACKWEGERKPRHRLWEGGKVSTTSLLPSTGTANTHKLTHRMLSTWADLASFGESQAVVVLSKAHPPSASVMMELMIAAAAAGTAWPESEKLQGICTRPADDVTASRFSWQQNISSIFLRHSRCRRIKENIDLLYQRIKKKKKTPISVVVSRNTMRGAGEHGKPFMFLKEQAEKGEKKLLETHWFFPSWSTKLAAKCQRSEPLSEHTSCTPIQIDKFHDAVSHFILTLSIISFLL